MVIMITIDHLYKLVPFFMTQPFDILNIHFQNDFWIPYSGPFFSLFGHIVIFFIAIIIIDCYDYGEYTYCDEFILIEDNHDDDLLRAS